MNELQRCKELVWQYYQTFDHATTNNLHDTLDQFTSADYYWRGVEPFREQQGTKAVVDVFWQPLRQSFSALQRRQDVFLAGYNDASSDEEVWACSMGHLVGLFDKAWLDLMPTGKIAHLRYAEFHQIKDNQITQTALFVDVISLMQQIGLQPLPAQTGASFIYPGPRTHDGLLLTEQDPIESKKTMDLVNRMVQDLDELNRSGNDSCPPELLARTWHDDMTWYGPAGIGASFTIERYQKQHQYPFRQGLKGKVFNGHVARFSEGSYACFFGWPNLTNTAKGGFLGMTGNETRADMRVVDVYRRDGQKLAENWVFIDLLHYLHMQGLDVLERMRVINQDYSSS